MKKCRVKLYLTNGEAFTAFVELPEVMETVEFETIKGVGNGFYQVDLEEIETISVFEIYE